MWPKYIDFYIHADDEDNYREGIELGLTEEAAQNYQNTGYELKLRLQVNMDGSNKLLAIEGIDVSDKGISI